MLRGCYTQVTCLATLRKVEGRSTFLATRNATIVVAKWGVTREVFLATCNATFVALQVARKIASCNMALSEIVSKISVVFLFSASFKNSNPREKVAKLSSFWDWRAESLFLSINVEKYYIFPRAYNGCLREKQKILRSNLLTLSAGTIGILSTLSCTEGVRTRARAML